MWLEQGEGVRGGILKGAPLESLPWEPASWCLKPPGEIMSAAISGGATAGADSGGGNSRQTRQQDREENGEPGWLCRISQSWGGSAATLHWSQQQFLCL